MVFGLAFSSRFVLPRKPSAPGIFWMVVLSLSASKGKDKVPQNTTDTLWAELLSQVGRQITMVKYMGVGIGGPSDPIPETGRASCMALRDFGFSMCHSLSCKLGVLSGSSGTM